MTSQLPLGIRWRDYATFENFYTGKNAQLISSLVLDNEQFVYLWGEQGSGKSHLLQAVCQRAHARSLPAHGEGNRPVYLPMSELTSLPPSVLQGMEEMNPVCIDDIQLVAGISEWEVAIFHLYNRLREQGVKLRVSASVSPSQTGIVLPDLRSRLGWGEVYQLHTLTDEGKRNALQQRAAQRGLQLADDVVQFILKRSARDMNSLFELLEKLDRASLAQQRKLTIPFVKSQLDENL